MIISGLQLLARPIFGDFEREEFKKFARLGVIFALILGTYWTLRVMKDQVFSVLIDPKALSRAKMVSLVVLFPVVMLYSKLLERYSRERMFDIMSGVYGIGTLLAALGLAIFQAQPEIVATYSSWGQSFVTFLGYAIYVFVESYGSLVVALFWAYASDITDPDSAKKGFYLTTAIAQIGGIVGPRYITQIPDFLQRTIGTKTVTIFGKELVFDFSTEASAFFAAVVLVVSVALFMRYFISVTPARLMASYHGKNEKKEEKEQEPGFFEGLRLLVSHKYLLAIFFAIVSYEIIVTIFDYNFKNMVFDVLGKGAESRKYLGWYGSMVNTVSLACLLLGISNITRIMGVAAALILMPLLVGFAVTGFVGFQFLLAPEYLLHFLFFLMVASKAINYALNGPAMKQLYIPTTHDVRFKSQAWIETFGSRGSKGLGSAINDTRKVLSEMSWFGIPAYTLLCGGVGYGLVIAWFFVAIFLGRTYNRAITEKRVVC